MMAGFISAYDVETRRSADGPVRFRSEQRDARNSGIVLRQFRPYYEDLETKIAVWALSL